MKTTFKDALDHAIETTGLTMAEIAKGADVSYDVIKNLHQGKAKRTNVEDARKIAAWFKVSLDDFYAGNLTSSGAKIAVAGRVGAGAQVTLTDEYAMGDGLYKIACPPQIAPSGIVGVEVQGDSMVPVYQPGDVLIYTRLAMGVPTEALNRICIIEDRDGHVWVKHLRSGSEKGLFNLLSANPTGQNMHDVALKWAAPIRFHLPAEFVSRV